MKFLNAVGSGHKKFCTKKNFFKWFNEDKEIGIIVKSKYCVLRNKLTENQNDKECKYDIGGYFIINGNEKVLITQEKLLPNHIQVYMHSKTASK